MNVLIYNSNEPLPKQGGMERVTDTLASLLKSAGHEVFLLCCYPNRLKEVYNPPVPLEFVPDFINRIKAQEFILNFIKNKQIDCIIDQTEGGIVGKYGFFNNRKPLGAIKLIAVLHNSAKAQINAMPYYLKRDMSVKVLQWFYDRVYVKLRQIRAVMLRKYLYYCLNIDYDKIVLLSPAFISEFQEFCPKINTAKLVAIPNPNTFEIPQGAHFSKDKIVLFVGRLENLSKGVDRLLRIWSKIYRQHQDWHLILVGDGSDRQKLEDLAKELDLRNYIFKGFQSPLPYYKKSSIFCMTSNFEGFGMVLTEAMQCGTVPMAFDSYSAVHDIIDSGKNGYIIPAFDEDEYAVKLSELMTEGKRLVQMSSLAKEKSEIFSKENVKNEWINLLSRL